MLMLSGDFDNMKRWRDEHLSAAAAARWLLKCQWQHVHCVFGIIWTLMVKEQEATDREVPPAELKHCVPEQKLW